MYHLNSFPEIIPVWPVIPSRHFAHEASSAWMDALSPGSPVENEFGPVS